MPRIQQVSPPQAQGEIKEIYDNFQKKIGKVPNIFQHMANSKEALDAYLALSNAVESTKLEPKVRSKIALAVAETNGCHYCLSAHTAIATNLGVSEDEILKARKGEAESPKTDAILKFTKKVVDQRGLVSDSDVKSLKASGVSDGELVEIFLAIMLTMFTNYFNHIVKTEIDFPIAPQL